jgi:hypothetical protein
MNLRFGGTYRLHFQGNKLAEQEKSAHQVARGWFHARLTFFFFPIHSD